MRKTIAAFTIFVVVLATLSGFIIYNAVKPCFTSISEGPETQLLDVSGQFGRDPEVDFASPMHPKKAQKRLFSEGAGKKVGDGIVQVSGSIYNAQTGSQIQSFVDPSFLDPNQTEVFHDALKCVAAGSRIGMVVPGADLGAATESEEAFVIVLDILNVVPTKATGKPQRFDPSFPFVTFAPNGQPGVSLPRNRAEITEPRVHALKLGESKAVVQEDSRLLLHYNVVGWDSNALLASTWNSSAPDLVDLGASRSEMLRMLPNPLLEQLIDYPIGSQLLIELPRTVLFPASVWVVDLLGAY